jgi:hypothetical protein
MIDLNKAITAVIEAEYELQAARFGLAQAFCERMLPDEVAHAVAAQRAARLRVIHMERLLEYYRGQK